LNCLKHTCKEKCHPGNCQKCEIEKEETCYCGKSKQTRKCSNTEVEYVNDEERSFSCENECGKLLNCKNHKCKKNCHLGECGDCEFLNQTKCPCGKTQLKEKITNCLSNFSNINIKKVKLKHVNTNVENY
jgi:hypothetical protein